jgi:mRNA-degrading endonuclease RelE of RelBE toxin-antitoxin system
MNYKTTEAFLKDFKKLERRYKTLADDLEVVKRNAIELTHVLGIDNRSTFRIQGVGSNDVQIYKLKKFACKSLKGTSSHSGIRIIYAFKPKERIVVFLEIYYKGDQELEDQQRIKDYLQDPAHDTSS